MFDGVGRRRDHSTRQLVSIGQFSLNGYERDSLFRNNGDGTFTDVGYVNRADLIEDGRGVSVFDYDEDGHVDLAVRNYRQPAQLLHNTSESNHWLKLRLIGTQSNRDAVGARILLLANGSRQSREVHAGSGYLSSSSLIQHFGIGPATHVDAIHVRWPSGRETHLTKVPANRVVTLREDGRLGRRAAMRRRASPEALPLNAAGGRARSGHCVNGG